MFKTFLILWLLCSTYSMADTIKYPFERIHQNKWVEVGEWKVRKVEDHGVLELTKKSNQYFNLCFTKELDFLNGTLSVKFRANSGHIDQGGGIMWRVQDKDNYYVARFNPLEDNFRFYIVHDGMRSELASADIKLISGWHSMKIVQKGAHFEGYLDGKKLLNLEDTQLQNSGGVGVWTKADALTSFDGLSITK